MRVLVTGGAGFIGSHFAKRLQAAGDDVRVLDKLTYSGNPANLDGTGIELVVGDICDADAVAEAADGCDAIVNFAAETHVDRSILGATDFGRTEFFGTQVLLEEVRRTGARFVQVSTDEVYGDLAARRLGGRDRPDQALEPVQRRQGRRRPAHPGLRAHVRRQRLDHARLEHVRAEPVSGEADPADDHERARGRAAAGLRRRPPDSRLALGRGPLRRDRARAARGRGRRGLQRRRRRRARERRDRRPHPRADRRRRVARPPRRGPGRPRPPLLARHREAARRSAGSRGSRSRRASPRRSPGTATTAAGGSRSSRASTASTTSASTRRASREIAQYPAQRERLASSGPSPRRSPSRPPSAAC